MTAGRGFGELALINNQPRAATIKCLTECHLAVIKKEDYDALLKKIELKREKRLVDFLESLPYFGSLSRVALVKLKYLMMQKEYIKTMTVVKEKEPSTKVFIIRSGEFTVYKTTELFPNDKLAEKEEKEKFTLQKILDIQRKRQRSLNTTIPTFGST